MKDLTHFDESGQARMVDVGDKPVTPRMARATARVHMSQATVQRIRAGGTKKGDVLAVARLAGIMAAKRTDALIPLCHRLALDAVDIDFDFPALDCLSICATARTVGRTGVEMEALTAVSIAALTIYDMCKSMDRGMVIQRVQLEEKSGGQSGHFVRESSGDAGR